MERRYAEATDRLRAADELRSASAADAAGKERELSQREAAVHRALAVINETGSG